MVNLITTIVIIMIFAFLYKFIRKKLKSRHYIANVFSVLVLVSLLILFFRASGFGLTPLQASMANKFISSDAELLKELKVGQYYLHICRLPREQQYWTAITERVGIFYKSKYVSCFNSFEEDMIRTLGGGTVQTEDGEVSVLCIETSDEQVTEIAAIDPEGEYIARQQIKVGEPCIIEYSCPVGLGPMDIKIIALNGKQDVVYYYGYRQEGSQIIDSEYKWHAVEFEKLDNNLNVKIKSGNLVTNYNNDTVLGDIDVMGLNTLNIPVVINIRDLSASDMSIDNYSKEQAIRLIKKLRVGNINIILEPYPWIDNGSKYETEWLPEDMDAFFHNWKTKILKPLIDEIAVPYSVEAINIGSSFTMMEDWEEQFCDMVDYVRRYYDGLVTYRTSWWKTVDWNDKATEKIQQELASAYYRKLNNKLFGKLDFISIAAYFELTEKDTNTVDNLVEALYSTQIYNRKQNVKQEIENFYIRWNKPVFFGELGFPPKDRASFAPWNPHPSDKYNAEEQANCFKAYRRVFEKEQWHLGFSIFAIGSKEADNNYYPSYESIEVIKQWYSK